MVMNTARSARNRGSDSTTLADKCRLFTAFVPAGGARKALGHRKDLETYRRLLAESKGEAERHRLKRC